MKINLTLEKKTMKIVQAHTNGVGLQNQTNKGIYQ